MQTTTPDWVFGVMVLSGLGFFAAAALLFLLVAARRFEPPGRRYGLLLALWATGSTGFAWWTQFNLEGWEGLRRAVVGTVAVVAVLAPFAAVIEREGREARRGRDLVGWWRPARAGAQALAGVLTVTCGAVAGSMFTLQVLSFRPC